MLLRPRVVIVKYSNSYFLRSFLHCFVCPKQYIINQFFALLCDAGQLELFQKGISEVSTEDNELGDDPSILPAVDGEEGPLNGQRSFVIPAFVSLVDCLVRVRESVCILPHWK